VRSWNREYDVREGDNGSLEKLSAETGGVHTENPAELLSFRDTAARKRRDLTWIFALLAALLFLFDVAQRRLDWLREPEKKEKAEAPAEAPAKTKAAKKKKAREQAPPQEKAADVLWQNMQNRKRL